MEFFRFHCSDNVDSVQWNLIGQNKCVIIRLFIARNNCRTQKTYMCMV